MFELACECETDVCEEAAVEFLTKPSVLTAKIPPSSQFSH